MFACDYSEGDTCVGCHDTCNTCAGPNEDDCTSCKSGLQIYDSIIVNNVASGSDYASLIQYHAPRGACLDQCIEGTGPTDTVCIPCSEHCLSCHSGRCVECAAGFAPNEKGVCMIDCFNVIPGCDECDNTRSCKTCANGFVANGNNICRPIC